MQEPISGNNEDSVQLRLLYTYCISETFTFEIWINVENTQYIFRFEDVLLVMIKKIHSVWS